MKNFRINAVWYHSKFIDRDGKIFADNIEIGKGVIVEDDVVIGGKEEPAKKVILGDFSYIGKGTKIWQ